MLCMNGNSIKTGNSVYIHLLTMGCRHSKVRSKKEVRIEDPTELTEQEIRVDPNVSSTNKLTDHEIREDSNVSSTNKLADHEIIMLALKNSTPDYEFSYYPETKTRHDEKYQTMKVDNDQIVSVFPDNLDLSYGKENSGYLLKGINIIDKSKHIFNYVKTEKIKTYMITPYYTPNTVHGSTIACLQQDLSTALKDRCPVKAVGEVLRSDKELTEKETAWTVDGNDEKFSVSTGTVLFWQEIDTRKKDNKSDKAGKIKLTKNTGNRLQLILKDETT